MNTLSPRHNVHAVLLVLLASLMLGCGGPKMQRLDVVVKLDQTLIDNKETVEVDLVAVAADRRSAWETRDVSDYFFGSGSEKDRAELDVTARDRIVRSVTLNAETPEVLITRKDRIWTVWSRGKAMHLFVLSNYPYTKPAGADTDSRRQYVSLDSTAWKGQKPRVEFVVTRSGVQR
jgi:hypothetical protein